MAGAAAVHDLHEQGAAFLVHSVCDDAPAFCLLVGRNTCLARECAVGPRREGSLRNYQTGRCTLRVVLLVQLGRYTAFACTLAGQCRHGDAII